MGKCKHCEKSCMDELWEFIDLYLVVHCVLSLIEYMIDIIKKIIHKEKLPVADIIFLIFILGIPIGLLIVLLIVV